MSVWRRFHDHGLPSLVTTNIDGRKRIFGDGRVAEMLVNVIGEVQEDEGIGIHAYVVMPDHLHLALSVPPAVRLGRVMQLIKGRFAWRYNCHIRESGSVWQGRFHERALRDEDQVIAAIQYVEGNPVVAGLVSGITEYPWSSAYRPAALCQAKSLTPRVTYPWSESPIEPHPQQEKVRPFPAEVPPHPPQVRLRA